MNDAGWWKTFFQGPAVEVWRRAHGAEVTRVQAADIARALALERGERVLDVPCGNARIALELAARGCRLAGLDYSTDSIAEARREAAARELEVQLFQGDMRALPWSAEFDAAFCAGNSFGYLDDPGNRAFLESVARSLRPGGRFLLEYPLVAELALARRTYRDWQRFGELLLLADGAYDERSGRLETAYTFIDLARPSRAHDVRSASYRIYSASEVADMLRGAGFTEVLLLGELEGSPFDADCAEFFARAVRA